MDKSIGNFKIGDSGFWMGDFWMRDLGILGCRTMDLGILGEGLGIKEFRDEGLRDEGLGMRD